MFYAPCASRRRGHIFFMRCPPTIRPCAPCLHLQNAGNCIFLHKNLRKYFLVLSQFIYICKCNRTFPRRYLSTSSRRMTAGSQEGILALSVLTRNVWKTFQPKEREEEIVCPFLCISMILVQPRLYLYHIRTQDGAVYFVHSFVPEVISRLPE